MSSPTVLFTIEEVQATAPGLSAPASVATVTINRPANSNALDPQTMQAFVDAMQIAGEHPDLRAIVITGAGERAFIGGADIEAMSRLNADSAREFITQVHACCRAVRQAPVPVIARINGVSFGAGLELAASCDLLVASSHAKFGMPEVRLGIPSVVEAALLPGIVGQQRAREILLLGDTFGAEEALQWGLIHLVTPRAALDEAVGRWIASLLQNGPLAVRQQKKLLNEWRPTNLDDAIANSIDAFADAWRSDEPARMMRAWIAARDQRRAARAIIPRT